MQDKKLGTHAVDKTSTDNDQTYRMAKRTYAALVRYAMLRNCYCRPNSWTATMDADVRRFSAIDAGFITNHAADIGGDVGGGYVEPRLARPDVVQAKARALGF